MIEDKQLLPFNVSARGEDITIRQGDKQLVFSPRGTEILIEMLQVIVKQKSADQVFGLGDLDLPGRDIGGEG